MASTAPASWYQQYEDDIQKRWQLLAYEAAVISGVVLAGQQVDLLRRGFDFLPAGGARLAGQVLAGVVVAEWARIAMGWPPMAASK